MSVSQVDLFRPLFPSLDTKNQLIETCSQKFKKEIHSIHLEKFTNPSSEIQHQDDNYKVFIEVEKNKKISLSLFAFNDHGKRKNLHKLTEELTKKIQLYLDCQIDLERLLLPSGAILQKHKEIPIEVENGYLKIAGKIVVFLKNRKFLPFSASCLHSYTLIETKKEGDLFILTDEHDKVRNDGFNEGFIFNLKQPLKLLISFSQKKEEPADCLLLYRSKKEALSNDL